MPPRRDRIAVVMDTNVVVGYYLSRTSTSANGAVFHLWRDQRKLQLVVSEELEEEYLEVLRRLNVDERRVQRFRDRLQKRETVTHVRLGTRFDVSRDPDDNLLLATATAGKAKYLITNDQDLLNIPTEQQRKWRFLIVTPVDFLLRVSEERGSTRS